MTKTTKTDKTGANKIKKIDSTIYEAGIKHGLGVKDIGFVQDIIKGKTQTEAYKNNIAKPTTTDRKTVDTSASEKVRKKEIQNTLKDVLISNNITKDSVIKQHQAILSQAIEVKQLSTAEKCNTKFMQLLGIDTYQPSTTNNIQVNIDKLSIEQVNDRLKDIITL